MHEPRSCKGIVLPVSNLDARVSDIRYGYYARPTTDTRRDTRRRLASPSQLLSASSPTSLRTPSTDGTDTWHLDTTSISTVKPYPTSLGRGCHTLDTRYLLTQTHSGPHTELYLTLQLCSLAHRHFHSLPPSLTHSLTPTYITHSLLHSTFGRLTSIHRFRLHTRLLLYVLSPRMRRASWMSLGMMVTRLAWMAHKLVSSKRPARGPIRSGGTRRHA